MDPALRIVTRLPLDELWDRDGLVSASRMRTLSRIQVVEFLRSGAGGAIADIGEPLRWLAGNELFAWWKDEAKPRLLDPAEDVWSVEDLPDKRGWLASEWELAEATKLVLFEAFH
jgi:hypothetical protein